MKKLNKQFTSRGFEHKQITRNGDKAIYERNLIGSDRKHYEVIKIQSHNGYEIAGKHYEVIKIQSHNGYEIAGKHYEPSEFYPSSSSWGALGFTYNTLKEAKEKFNQV